MFNLTSKERNAVLNYAEIPFKIFHIDKDPINWLNTGLRVWWNRLSHRPSHTLLAIAQVGTSIEDNLAISNKIAEVYALGLPILVLIYSKDTCKQNDVCKLLLIAPLFIKQKIDYIIVNIPKLQTLFVTVRKNEDSQYVVIHNDL